MIAPITRRKVARGYYRLAGGETSRSGEVAPTSCRSLECKTCGRVIGDNPGGRAAHRRACQTEES